MLPSHMEIFIQSISHGTQGFYVIISTDKLLLKWKVYPFPYFCLFFMVSSFSGACNALCNLMYFENYLIILHWCEDEISSPAFYLLYFIVFLFKVHCATIQKVAVSIPEGVIGIFHCHNPSGHIMTVRLTQPLTEMNTRNISWGKGGWCVGQTN